MSNSMGLGCGSQKLRTLGPLPLDEGVADP